MSDTTNDTKDTKATRRTKRSGDANDTGLPDEDELYREPMRRDHFPNPKGDNQQDDDYTAEIAAEENREMAERNVKWPEVDSQEALDAKIDEEQSDKEKRLREAAREFDEEARAAATSG